MRCVIRAGNAWSLSIALAVLANSTACFDPQKKDFGKQEKGEAALSGELFATAAARGLDPNEQLAAVKTFVPTGGRDDFLALMSTGSSGRLAIVGMPSMRVLKYVGIFTPEPWQGFGYDDESIDVILASAREDIEYRYGDMGLPALSETDGRYDGKTVFFADGANARLALMHLTDFEVTQIVSNPIFKTSSADLAVTPNTEYVLQTTRFPDLPGGGFGDVSDGALTKLRGGLTFWRFDPSGHGAKGILEASSFTVELPPYLQGETDAGKGATAGWVFTLAECKHDGGTLAGMNRCNAGSPGVLHVTHVVRAKSAAGVAGSRFGDHRLVSLAVADAKKALFQVELPPQPTSLAISPDGTTAVITHRAGNEITVIDLAGLLTVDPYGVAPDAFGVRTLPLVVANPIRIDVGGASVDAAFTSVTDAVISVFEPGALVLVDVKNKKAGARFELDAPGSRLIVPESESASPKAKFVVAMNKRPTGRLPKIGPHKPLNPVLYELDGSKITRLYSGAVPQATDLAGIAVAGTLVDGAVRYALGTDSRTGELAEYRTTPGNERVEREGNRVHVFGTLIRSHIVPEIVEVELGDVVTFHLTNLEQAQDQTHGFTVSTYNVHGSWEPGKVASVTFTADREGIFPYYCTEFCSALHLEMMGYLLVKPKNWVDTAKDLQASELSPEEAKKLFDEKSKVIEETQEVINSVVAWLKENDFESDPRAAALVLDATNQLAEIDAVKAKVDSAVAEQDWNGARLWAEQLYQYQVKAADAGLRAKKILEERTGEKL